MNPTILIVDDCTDIARIISHYLESASYRTVTATSGLKARAVLDHMTPDCIVLDLMMPGMSGAELLHGLRRDPATAGIPIVLVSARVGHYGTHFGAELDADFSVGKPFTRQQIVQAVRTVLARKDGIELEEVAASSPPRLDSPARITQELWY